MSIADKITSIETHIGDIYDTLELGGADLTNVNKNIVNIKSQLKDRYLDYMNNGTQEIWDNWEKVTGEGTSLTLNNTEQAPIKMDLKGNTSQTGTPTPSSPIPVNVVSGDNDIEVCGKNLLDESSLEMGGIDAETGQNTVKQDEFRTNGYISVQGGNTYTLSNYNYSSYNYRGIFEYDENHSYIKRTNNTVISTSQSFSLTLGSTTKYVRIRYIANSSIPGVPTNMQMQYEKGSSASTYEPYQGNTYNIDLPIENLLPTEVSAWEQGSISNGSNSASTTRIRTIDYYPIKNDTNYYVSINSSNYCFLNIIIYNNSKTYIAQYFAIDSNINGAKSLLINIPSTRVSNVAYMRVVIKNADNTSTITPSEITTIKPQIETGTKKNSFTPYGTTPIELCKIGNYQDYFYKDSGKWYLYKAIGKVVLNGSENWIQNTVYNKVYYIENYLTEATTTETRPMLSNYFTYGGLLTQGSGGVENGKFYQWTNLPQRLVLGYDTTSLDNFKNWLGTHNTSVYFPLATPTNTEITNTTLINQLETLKGAMSYEGQTNISQVNNDLPFIISASALKKGN